MINELQSLQRTQCPFDEKSPAALKNFDVAVEHVERIPCKSKVQQRRWVWHSRSNSQALFFSAKNRLCRRCLSASALEFTGAGAESMSCD